MNLKQRRKAVLEDTISFYNSSNRAYDLSNNKCMYCTPGKRRCAIGRLLSEKEAIKLQGHYGNLVVRELFDYLPKSIQELGVCFLIELQDLHDTAACWDEIGITEKGKERAQLIKYGYC